MSSRSENFSRCASFGCFHKFTIKTGANRLAAPAPNRFLFPFPSLDQTNPLQQHETIFYTISPTLITLPTTTTAHHQPSAHTTVPHPFLRGILHSSAEHPCAPPRQPPTAAHSTHRSRCPPLSVSPPPPPTADLAPAKSARLVSNRGRPVWPTARLHTPDRPSPR